jgi:hypothetical protein
MDHIHPLDNFWFNGEPPDRIENILRKKRFEAAEVKAAPQAPALPLRKVAP